MEVKAVLDMIEDLLKDSSVPRNVKKSLEEAKIALNEKTDDNVRVMKAVYSFEKVIEDPNLMPHVRMQLWQLMSALESVKSKK